MAGEKQADLRHTIPEHAISPLTLKNDEAGNCDARQ